MQHEITSSVPLLDEHGNLTEPGFARRLLPVYDRKKVRSRLTRLKEWDYYYVGNDRFGAALTIADNGYMGLDSISFLSFTDAPWEITKSVMRAFPLGRTDLPASSDAGVSASAGRHHRLTFRTEGGERTLCAHMDRFRGEDAIDVRLTLTDEPRDSMVICTPFEKPGHFYYNQKINCLRASGTVTLGDDVYVFRPDEAFGVLDWGRGVWTYHNTWYWGSASGLCGGVPFGFNIGYGFGDTSAATENMLFYGGRAHKLSAVTFHIPQSGGKDDFLRPWRFSSDDGRFELDFRPVIDRAACTDFKLLKSNQHQVFGRFSGTVILDDGTRLAVSDLFGFAEKVENKW